jgi:hypothetical protein
MSTVDQPIFIPDPDTNDFIFNGHAGTGPSGAERWMNCTGSLGMTRRFLETLSPAQAEAFAGASSAARQGTTAHAAAEAEASVVLGTISAEEAAATLLELTIMPEVEDEAYDAEMGEFITEYVDLVKQYHDADRTVMLEQTVEAVVPLTGNHEGEVYIVRGSADCIALPVSSDPDLVVADLKYGDGVHVDAEHNPQIRIYGLGALSQLVDPEGNLITPVESITYHIVQPRLGGIKTWTEPIADLIAWRDEVLAPALTAALYGPEEGATLTPSDEACQWCPVRGACPALAEQRMTAAADLFDVVVEAEFADGPGSFPETESLDDARLGELLTQINGLVDLQKDLKEEAQRRLHRGTQVPGFKLVGYTPPRKWTEQAQTALDPEHCDPDLRETIELLWKHSLITPKQALAIMAEAAEELDGLYETPDKRPIIAPEGDRRKEWTGQPPEQMFTAVSGNDGD